jgi:ATP-binding cassette subfamily C protein
VICKNCKYVISDICRRDSFFIKIFIANLFAMPVLYFSSSLLLMFITNLIVLHQIKYILGIIITFLCLLVARIVNSRYWNLGWPHFEVQRLRYRSNLNRRLWNIDFESYENIEVLDLKKRAEMACNDGESGIIGLVKDSYSLFYSFLCIILSALILNLNVDIKFLVILICAAVIKYVSAKKLKEYCKNHIIDKDTENQRKKEYYNDLSTDYSVRKDIILFDLKEYIIHNIYDSSKKSLKTKIHSERLNLAFEELWNAIFVFIQGVYLYSLIVGVLNNECSVGELTLCMSISGKVFNDIYSLCNTISDMSYYNMQVIDYMKFMSIDVYDSDSLIKLSSVNEIELKNVSFKYSDNKENVLNNISLKFGVADSCVVVGVNGSGKSTLLNIILGLYTPTNGVVLVNGIDLKYIDKKSYWKNLSVILQSCNLFAFTLEENITLEDNTVADSNRLWEVLDEVGLMEKVENLNLREHTEILKTIDGNGAEFSGGEKQKLLIARGLYKNGYGFIFDEPTSALDPDSEINLACKLYGFEDKIKIVTSHRLAFTKNCNRIIMLEDGSIKENGPFEQLLSENGAFKAMYDRQARYYIGDCNEN